MISIVYGSPVAGLLSSADLADDAPVNAQYLRTVPSSQLILCAMSPTNLSFEKTIFDCCGRKIDRIVSVEQPIFSQFKIIFAFEAKSTPARFSVQKFFEKLLKTERLY
jgi:hypothetical protein